MSLPGMELTVPLNKDPVDDLDPDDVDVMGMKKKYGAPAIGSNFGRKNWNAAEVRCYRLQATGEGCGWGRCAIRASGRAGRGNEGPRHASLAHWPIAVQPSSVSSTRRCYPPTRRATPPPPRAPTLTLSLSPALPRCLYLALPPTPPHS